MCFLFFLFIPFCLSLGLGSGVCGLGFGVWSLGWGSGVWGLGSGVWVSGFGGEKGGLKKTQPAKKKTIFYSGGGGAKRPNRYRKKTHKDQTGKEKDSFPWGGGLGGGEGVGGGGGVQA